jgi:hypothetical protein
MNSDHPLKPGILKREPVVDSSWHAQQILLLQQWAEISSSYRWLHDQSYTIYRKKNLNFMIPIIVISTVTGTASFSLSSFPPNVAPYVPPIIGFFNLVAGLMTTVYQFLKISEYMESHRQTSISYGKLSRNITVELNLPVVNRSSSGVEFVKLCRNEIDRLIEQSPLIPKTVLNVYEVKFKDSNLIQPEILSINKVKIFEDTENNIGNIVANAGSKFSEIVKLAKLKRPPTPMKRVSVPSDGTFTPPPKFESRKEAISRELDVLSKSGIVTTRNTSIVNQDTDTDAWKLAIEMLKPEPEQLSLEEIVIIPSARSSKSEIGY